MKSPIEVINAIKANQIDSVYLLSGAEKYFQDEVIGTLASQLFPDKGSRDLNEITLYGTENSQADILTQFSSYPMLAEKKLIVVRDFEKMKIEDPETFEKYLIKPPKFSVLILCVTEEPKNKFFNKIKSTATVVNCKPIYENQLPQWIKQYCQAAGFSITNEAAHFLVANIGTNILTIKNEIEKVISFKADQTAISVDDLQATSGLYREANVFALQKALMQRNLAKSLAIAHQLLEAGIDSTMINAILFSFFRKALIVSALKRQGKAPKQIAQKMKLADFQMRDINQALQKFSFLQLKKVVQWCSQFDRMQKGIEPSPISSLELLCYQICRT